jgi:hypothetical protein
LFESFEVDAIQFLAPETPARSYGRSGWERKPLAYVVVRAKDPAVDRIPPLGIDLDFTDGKGWVSVAVTSPPVLIDADTEPAPRPLIEPRLELTLDDRELADGKLELEVRATALGVLPDLTELVADPGALGGLELVETTDNGLNLIEIDPERNPPTPLAERSWTLEYRVTDDNDGRFSFPAALDPETQCTWRRFADYDIVELSAGMNLPLAAWRASGLATGPWIALLALLLGAFGLFSVLNRPEASDAAYEALRPPPDPTPLSAVGYLERLVSERGSRFDPETIDALRSDVAEIEARYFAPSENGAPQAEDEDYLRQLVQTWEARAR